MWPMLPFKKMWCLLSSGRRPSAPWTRTRQTAALCTSTTPWWPHFPPASAGTTVHPPLTLCPAWSAHASLEGTAAASWSVCVYAKNELSVFLRLARFCFLSLQREKVSSMRNWWLEARAVGLLNLSSCGLIGGGVAKRAWVYINTLFISTKYQALDLIYGHFSSSNCVMCSGCI